MTKSNKNWGYQVVPDKAFKKVDPTILVKMTPIPELNRRDYNEYLKNNDIEREY